MVSLGAMTGYLDTRYIDRHHGSPTSQLEAARDWNQQECICTFHSFIHLIDICNLHKPFTTPRNTSKFTFITSCFLLPRTTRTLRPKLIEPLIRLLRNILIQYLPLKLGNMIARQVVQRVLLIGTSPNSVRDRLNIVANLLVHIVVDVGDLTILDTVLITVVGVDLSRC
jgi:hypothetical protein